MLVLKSAGIAAPHIMQHLADGFAELGHEVLTFDLYMIRTRGMSDAQLMRIIFQKLTNRLNEFKPEIVLSYAMGAFFPTNATGRDSNPPDFVFDPEHAMRYGCNTHLLSASGAPHVFCYFDDPFNEADNLAAVKGAPRQWFSVWDRHYLEKMRSGAFRNTFFLPLATSAGHFFAIDTGDLDERYLCEVCFVGSPTPGRAAILEKLAGRAALGIFGPPKWKEYKAVANCWRGECSYPLETNMAYNGARIVLDAGKEGVMSALTQRAFDALAGGNLVITDNRPGLAELLTPDREIVTCESVDELLEKTESLLKNDQTISAISTAGQKRVLSEHTWTRRAETIIETVFGN
ncbi:MAG: glycosyltransferase [bacterium]